MNRPRKHPRFALANAARLVLAGLLAFLTMLSTTACGDFEDPTIVIDMRILAITVDPPEVVSKVDPMNPTDLELVDVEVCALVADPADARSLHFEMVACAPSDEGRCASDVTFAPITIGDVEDPETADAPVRMCGTLEGNARLVPVIQEAIEGDSLSGFGGVPVQIDFFARPADATLEQAVFGTKSILYSPKIPEERVANANPTLEQITVTRVATEEELVLPIGRCKDITPIEVAPGEVLNLLPVEPDGAREDYVVPTFDGGSRMFTENLRYSWFGTEGSDWEKGGTGGPKDFAGNEPKLDTDWRATQDPEKIGTGLDVSVWVVQRDERGGAAWFESCLRIVP